MVLSFKTKFPWGEPTYFKEKILAGVGRATLETHPLKMLMDPKLHTMRAGHRWKVGDRIHMATGVRTNKYNQFNKDVPELEIVKVVLPVKITWLTIHLKPMPLMKSKGGDYRMIKIKVAGHEFDLGHTQMKHLIYNDGFSGPDQFCRFFCNDFDGQLISWMDIKPNPLDWVHNVLIK